MFKIFSLLVSAIFTSAVFTFKLILLESEIVSLLNLLLNIAVVSEIFSLVSKASSVALLIGLFISDVLSTFSNPTFNALIPNATFASVIIPSANLAFVIDLGAILGEG